MQTIEKIEERVDRLEDVLGRFITHTDIALNRLERELEREMGIFREEMRKDREERQRDREEMEKDREERQRDREEVKKDREERQKDREEMKKDREEVEKFLEEMRKDREEMKKDREEMKKEFNKQWAALATKMGTIDEDLVAPAVRPVLGKFFNCEFNTRSIRDLRRINGEDFEVDVLAATDDKVFMIEVKSSPRSEYVAQILSKAKKFKKFFPEYKDKELIPVYASIIFPENILKHATRKALYVMAYREWEYMDIINFEEVTKMRQSKG